MALNEGLNELVAGMKMKKEMRMELQSLFAAALMSALAAPAIAQDSSAPNIDQRQNNQQKRIGSGVRSGQLSAQATHSLDQHEAKIEAGKPAAKAGDKVTPAERRHLQREENLASRAIDAEKHQQPSAQ